MNGIGNGASEREGGGWQWCKGPVCVVRLNEKRCAVCQSAVCGKVVLRE